MKIYKTNFLREKVVLKKGHKRCSASPAIGKCKSKPPWDRCHLQPQGWASSDRQMMIVDKDAETLGLSHATDGNVSGTAALENTLAVPQKVKYRVMIRHLGLYPGNRKYRFTQKLTYGYSQQHYSFQPQSGNNPKVHYLKNEFLKKMCAREPLTETISPAWW